MRMAAVLRPKISRARSGFVFLLCHTALTFALCLQATCTQISVRVLSARTGLAEPEVKVTLAVHTPVAAPARFVQYTVLRALTDGEGVATFTVSLPEHYL